MTDPEFFATYPEVGYRLRISFEGEAPEGSVIAVRNIDATIFRKIAGPEYQPTSNERQAKWAFEDSSVEIFDA